MSKIIRSGFAILVLLTCACPSKNSGGGEAQASCQAAAIEKAGVDAPTLEGVTAKPLGEGVFEVTGNVVWKDTQGFANQLTEVTQKAKFTCKFVGGRAYVELDHQGVSQ